MGNVQHFEIPADDLARAQKFYEETFSWKIAEWPMPDGSKYLGVMTGEKDQKVGANGHPFINGGMVARGATFPISSPSIAVTVTDIDASIEKVKAAGGTVVMEKMNMAGMGLYAYVKDTEGNTIGVWQELAK